MKITIASGKGGTGKTTLALSLASYFSTEKKISTHLVDCDVDASNAHLFMKKTADKSRDAFVKKAVLQEELCDGCRVCADVCYYNAITVLLNKAMIFDELCHSCGACVYACPQKAILFKDKAIGKFHFIDKDQDFKLTWGELNIGEVQAPDLIAQLKEMPRKEEMIIYDASPGAGCPVRETMLGSDLVVLVTEPTPFGLNDLKMAAALAVQMQIPTAIIVNRSRGEKDVISNFAQESGLPIIGRIPFDKRYARSCSEGKILMNEHEELGDKLAKIADRILAGIPKTETLPALKVTQFEEHALYRSQGKAKDHATQEFVIMSGKGGTGKTTLSSSLAELTSESLFFDADVDASNLPILLKGSRSSEKRFIGGQKAVIDDNNCIHCDLCRQNCHFNAITEDHRIIDAACEGCGFCEILCPENAISMEDAETGYVFLSESPRGPVSHAYLHIGEENSGKLVSQVRDQAYSVSHDRKLKQILGDGPPGTGCPVIAATTGADLAIIVTEPGMSAIHDMKRAVSLTKHFQLRSVLVINKADMNSEQKALIYDFCSKENIPVIGEIPFDEKVEQALRKEISVINYPDSPAAEAISSIYETLKNEYKFK
ncbi:MAG: P-loop NTPase [Candidatus Neomarinimicrobiota bacterium]